MSDKIDVCIDLDNQKYKRKKLFLNDNLKKIRNILKLKDSILFTGDDYPIDIEEEEQRILKDIIIDKGKTFSLSLKTKKKHLASINIYLNDKKIYTGNYSISIKLKDLIKDYENLLPKDSILYSNGYPIDISDYEDTEIKEMLDAALKMIGGRRISFNEIKKKIKFIIED